MIFGYVVTVVIPPIVEIFGGSDFVEHVAG